MGKEAIFLRDVATSKLPLCITPILTKANVCKFSDIHTYTVVSRGLGRKGLVGSMVVLGFIPSKGGGRIN